MELAHGVHLLPEGLSLFPGVYPPNVYLIEGEENGLVDTGLNDPAAAASRLEYVKARIKGRLKYIFITHGHPDHLGGARLFMKELGGQLVAHRSEEERLKNAAGGAGYRLVDGGERFDLGTAAVEAVHTPGHCPGHVCYLLEPTGALFCGDHVPGRGTTVVIPPRGDMSAYLGSLRRLLALDLKLACPGHGPVITAPKKKIGELVQHRLAREAQLLELLSRCAWRTEEMVREVYPELDPRLEEMARGQILAHLTKLRNEGLAEHKGTKWFRTAGVAAGLQNPESRIQNPEV